MEQLRVVKLGSNAHSFTCRTTLGKLPPLVIMRRLLPHRALFLVLTLTALHKAFGTSSNIQPNYGSVHVDGDGNLHLNPAFSGRVFVNGTDMFRVIQEMQSELGQLKTIDQEMQSELGQLKTKCGALDQEMQSELGELKTIDQEMQSELGQLKTRFDVLESDIRRSQNESGAEVNQYVHASDGALYLQAPNGVFLSNGKTHIINEGGDSWLPKTLRVAVGDTLNFRWATYEGVMQEDDKGIPTGAVSELSLGGEFAFKISQPGMFHFKGANKGYSVTVTAVIISGVGANWDPSWQLPSDVGEYTRAHLKVVGAPEVSNLNGYYTKLPSTCNGQVCYSKMLGPEVTLYCMYCACVRHVVGCCM